LAGIFLTAAGLYFAKTFFVPVALALLLTFLLAPLVGRLSRADFNNVFAVLSAVTITSLLVTAIGAVVVLQLYDLAQSLPEYRENIHSKVKAISSRAGGFKATRRFFEKAAEQPSGARSTYQV
jgi:predicted PurR-regulated permease PerM